MEVKNLKYSNDQTTSTDFNNLTDSNTFTDLRNISDNNFTDFNKDFTDLRLSTDFINFTDLKITDFPHFPFHWLPDRAVQLLSSIPRELSHRDFNEVNKINE